MKTLFGIRSKIAAILVGSVYLIVSINTTVNGVNKFKEFLSEYHVPSGSLFLNTETKFFHIFTLFLSLSCLLSSMLMILGTFEKRHNILKPWLIVNLALEAILTSGLFYLLYLFVQVVNTNWMNICGLLLAIFVNATAMAFQDYVRTGTYHLYKNFKTESIRLYPDTDGSDTESVTVV